MHPVNRTPEGIHVGFSMDPVEFAKKLLADNAQEMTDAVLQYLIQDRKQRTVAPRYDFSGTDPEWSPTTAAEFCQFVADSSDSFAERFASTYPLAKTDALIRALAAERDKHASVPGYRPPCSCGTVIVYAARKDLEKILRETGTQTDVHPSASDRTSVITPLSQALRMGVLDSIAPVHNSVAPFTLTGQPSHSLHPSVRTCAHPTASYRWTNGVQPLPELVLPLTPSKRAYNRRPKTAAAIRVSKPKSAFSTSKRPMSPASVHHMTASRASSIAKGLGLVAANNREFGSVGEPKSKRSRAKSFSRSRNSMENGRSTSNLTAIGHISRPKHQVPPSPRVLFSSPDSSASGEEPEGSIEGRRGSGNSALDAALQSSMKLFQTMNPASLSKLSASARKNLFNPRRAPPAGSRSRTAYAARRKNRSRSVSRANSEAKSRAVNLSQIIYIDPVNGVESHGGDARAVRVDKIYSDADKRPVYYCTLCPQFTKDRKGMYETHLRRHVVQQPFKCSIAPCTFSTTTKQSLQVHINYHTMNLPRRTPL